MNHKERILRTARGEPVDRVPIASPVSWTPAMLPGGPLQADLRHDDANLNQVLDLVEEHCDEFTRSRGVVFDRGHLQIPVQYIRKENTRKGNRVITINVVETPKGNLQGKSAAEDGIRTAWSIEPLIKDKGDVERILSVPYSFDEPDYQEFFKAREWLGDRGVLEVGVSVPLVSVSHMFSFDQFFLWCAAERETIMRLIETVFERTYDRLERVLKEGVGPVFWFGGSEQATPPMMSPELFDELSIAYDKQLFDLVHRYGGLVHVHCHGKISGILSKLVDAGVDFLDPVEPPPQGDITMEDAKRLCDGKTVLLGNIEFCDLEFDTPAEIDRKVFEAIIPGGKKHMILYPSATPITPLTDRYRDNAIQFITSGLKYGSMNGDS